MVNVAEPADPAAIGRLLAERDERSAAWDRRIGELLALRDLADDWDGQGALAPGAGVVDAAVVLASRLRGAWPAPDFAVAGVNGTVILEWHGTDTFTELEVESADAAEVRRVAKATGQVSAARFRPGA
jgi:hypothetical protein